MTVDTRRGRDKNAGYRTWRTCVKYFWKIFPKNLITILDENELLQTV